MRTKTIKNLLEAVRRKEIRGSSVAIYLAIRNEVRKGNDRPSNIAIQYACGYSIKLIKLAKTELAAAGLLELEVVQGRGPIPSKITLP